MQQVTNHLSHIETAVSHLAGIGGKDPSGNFDVAADLAR